MTAYQPRHRVRRAPPSPAGVTGPDGTQPAGELPREPQAVPARKWAAPLDAGQLAGALDALRNWTPMPHAVRVWGGKTPKELADELAGRYLT